MEGCHLLGCEVVLDHSGWLEDGDAPVWPHTRVMYWYHWTLRQHTGVPTTQVDPKGRVLRMNQQIGTLLHSDRLKCSCCGTEPMQGRQASILTQQVRQPDQVKAGDLAVGLLCACKCCSHPVLLLCK
jgi:hypothetical protein